MPAAIARLNAKAATMLTAKNPVPIGVRHLLDRMHLLFRDAAGVVDQHIDRAACCLLDLRDPCRRYSAVGQVQHLCVESSLSGFGTGAEYRHRLTVALRRVDLQQYP